jgi:chromosome segregation ATPase
VLTASWRRSKHVEDALISEERHRHTEDALSTALYRLDALRDEARALWKRCETAEDARAPLEAHASKRNDEVRALRRDAFRAQERYRALADAHDDLKGDLAAEKARADGLAARNGDLQLDVANAEAAWEAVWKSTAGLGRPDQTLKFSSSVTSKSIRLIFGRIDRSQRVLEAQPKCACQNIRIRSR